MKDSVQSLESSKRIVPARPGCDGINQVKKVDEGQSKSCHPSVHPRKVTPPNLGRGASKIGRNRSLSQDKLGQKAHVNFAFNVKGTLEAANAMERRT